MSAQSARTRAPRRQQQMEVVRRAAEEEAEAAEERRAMLAVVDALPTDDEDEDEPASEQPQEQEPPPDPNFQTVNAILARLQAYGAKPSVDGPYQLVNQTQVHVLLRSLVAAGVIHEQTFDAEVWAEMAGKLRMILQQVEEQRLAQAEAQQAAMRRPQPAAMPGIIVPGRQ